MRWRLPLRHGRAAVPPELRLSRDAWVSLALHTCYSFGAAMSGVFVQLYLWRLTESLWVNGLYVAIGFILGPLAFALAGKIAKTKDRLFAYRTGIFLTTVFYLMVILVQEQVAEYFYVFAVFNGVAGAFYWLGFLTLIYDMSTERNRIRYLGINSVLFNLAGLAGPAVGGVLIAQFQGTAGYIFVFAIAFGMFVIATIGSFRLAVDPTHHHRYYLSLMKLVLKRNPVFMKAQFGWFTVGLLQGIMLFLPNLLLFSVVAREDTVGFMNMLFLGLSVAVSYGLSRYSRPEFARRLVLLAAVGYVAAASLLLGGVTLWSVVAFMCLFSMFKVVQMNSFSAYYYNQVGRLPLKGSLRVESIVTRETFLNTGRVIGIAVLLAFAGDLSGPLIPWVIFGACLSQFAFVYIMERGR